MKSIGHNTIADIWEWFIAFAAALPRDLVLVRGESSTGVEKLTRKTRGSPLRSAPHELGQLCGELSNVRKQGICAPSDGTGFVELDHVGRVEVNHGLKLRIDLSKQVTTVALPPAEQSTQTRPHGCHQKKDRTKAMSSSSA